MKSSAAIIIGLMALTGCQTVEPVINKDGVRVVEATTLNWVPDDQRSGKCSVSDDLKTRTFRGRDTSKSHSILAIAATALVTAGIDYVGGQIAEASDEETRTATAFQNVVGDRNWTCLRFAGGSDFEFFIELDRAMLENSDGEPDFSTVIPTLSHFSYKKSIDGKKDDVRGLALQISISRPGSESVVSQTINIGNVEIGASFSEDITVAMMPNPFRRVMPPARGQTASRIVDGWPFTITATLTEVENANAFGQFAADAFESANDDLTSELLSVLGLAESEETAPEMGAGQMDEGATSTGTPPLLPTPDGGS